MAILVKPRAEGAHWYSAQGEPVHTRPNVDGAGEHPTTLTDARKLILFPSVTNVLKVLAKHGLEKWKITQVLLAMDRLGPRKPEEPKQEYFTRVTNDAFEQVDRAQAGGGGLHQAILAALQGRGVREEFKPYIDKIFEFLERMKIVPQATEQTIVNHEHGFAGTLDLAAIQQVDGIPCILDWKTRRTKPGQPVVSYEVQPMQIAAYAATYWKTRWPLVSGGNIYISSTEPGRIEMIPYNNVRLVREWEVFKACCLIWRHLEQYDPRTAGSAAEMQATAAQEDKQEVIVISEPGPEFQSVTALAPSASQEGPAAIDIAPTSPDAEGRPKTARNGAVPKRAKVAEKIDKTWSEARLRAEHRKVKLWRNTPEKADRLDTIQHWLGVRLKQGQSANKTAHKKKNHAKAAR